MTAQSVNLEDILGYSFVDSSLLKLALRHASTTTKRTQSNERLEFLGDRVLGLTVAEILYNEFVDEDEGPLARRFAGLTSSEALARVASTLNLESFICVQSGDVESENRSRHSVLSDTLEAILGALYLDGGLRPPQQFIAKHWRALIREDLSPPKDAKTALQEWVQAQGLGLPLYDVLKQDGPDHAPIFTIQVTVKNFEPQVGQGSSRRKAEQTAAQNLLKIVENS